MFKRVVSKIFLLIFFLCPIHVFGDDFCSTEFVNNFSFGAVDNVTQGEVSRLQSFLVSQYGVNATFKVNGYFGRQTEATLFKLQRQVGIIPASSNMSLNKVYFGPVSRRYINNLCKTGLIGTSASTTQQFATSTSTTNISATGRSCTYSGKVYSHGKGFVAFQSKFFDDKNVCKPEFRQCVDGRFTGNFEFLSCSPRKLSCLVNGVNVPNGSFFKTDLVYNQNTCSVKLKLCSDGEVQPETLENTCEMAAKMLGVTLNEFLGISTSTGTSTPLVSATPTTPATYVNGNICKGVDCFNTINARLVDTYKSCDLFKARLKNDDTYLTFIQDKACDFMNVFQFTLGEIYQRLVETGSFVTSKNLSDEYELLKSTGTCGFPFLHEVKDKRIDLKYSYLDNSCVQQAGSAASTPWSTLPGQSSQLANFGVREVLNSINNKELVLISDDPKTGPFSCDYYVKPDNYKEGIRYIQRTSDKMRSVCFDKGEYGDLVLDGYQNLALIGQYENEVILKSLKQVQGEVLRTDGDFPSVLVIKNSRNIVLSNLHIINSYEYYPGYIAYATQPMSPSIFLFNTDGVTIKKMNFSSGGTHTFYGIDNKNLRVFDSEIKGKSTILLNIGRNTVGNLLFAKTKLTQTYGTANESLTFQENSNLFYKDLIVETKASAMFTKVTNQAAGSLSVSGLSVTGSGIANWMTTDSDGSISYKLKVYGTYPSGVSALVDPSNANSSNQNRSGTSGPGDGGRNN